MTTASDRILHKLREVNLAIEQCARGAFDTEFHPTYDFVPVWQSREERGG